MRKRMCPLETAKNSRPEIRLAIPEFQGALNFKSLKPFRHNGLNKPSFTTIQQISVHSRKLWLTTLCFAWRQLLVSVCWGCHDGLSECIALARDEKDQNLLLKNCVCKLYPFLGTYLKPLVREIAKIICVWPY